ncbi:S24 family peptidase [Laribacter hongkongensis]|uniref:S24 family peptidase n=1 Tax=Laribacter hongkongensis TaxID=168471 RepID=UPI001EFDDCFA|nr:S24 family peptidase [Laribacter hongkongensis]MCG8998137.1 S24 family peptidase [Laribacter hongkongensis]MCG9062741.1 S24 family peptidase [Laribacter hongkongensis]
MINLQSLVAEKKTIAAVSKAANTSPSYISQILTRAPSRTGKPRDVGSELARKLEDGCGKPTGWMDALHDDERIDHEVTSATAPDGSSIAVYENPDDLDSDSYVWIDRYDVQLSAGCCNLQWVINRKDPISFRVRWLQTKHLNPKNCKALYVRGRSMEPKLEDWDTVLIDTSQTEIIDGEIYAICLQDEFFIKTVERIAGGVKLKSENPDFESIEVRGNELGALRIIGKKVWRGG